jgi:hypothetical protein
MNREQLEVLFKAGLISQATYAASLTTLRVNGMCAAPQLTLEVAVSSIRLAVEDEPADDGSIVIEADITRYDELIPSHGLILRAGCFVVRQPLSNTKLLRDHNQGDPVGYMESVDADVVHASFRVSATHAARVQQEIDDKLRDGISVGFLVFDYEIDDDWNLHVLSGEVYEASLCAIPAVNSARVTDVAAALATARKENRTMNRAQLAAALAAGTITQAQYDAGIETITALEATLATPPAVNTPPEVVAGPTLQTQQSTPHATVVAERLCLSDVSRRLSEAVNTGDRSAFALAISDVLPADDAGTAFINRDDWQGELFTSYDPTRPWVDAWGTPQPLTSIKGKGWRWVDEPDVDEYAGNKTEVPSNDILTESETFTAFRIAAGWDVDRIFEDLADAEFFGPFWEAVMRAYVRKSNAAIRTRTLAAALAPGDTVGGTETVAAGGVLALLKQVIRDGRAIEGGRINRIFLAEDQFQLLEDVPTDDLPLWLKSAVIGLDIAEGTSDVGPLRIAVDGTLADGQVTGFDNRAAVVREKAPFQVQAINVPNGGIDLGIFSYMRFEPNDTRLIITRTYGEELPEA